MQFPTIPGFQFHRHQGSGPIGHVFEATWDKKQRCAVKILRPASVQKDYVNWCFGKLVGKPCHPNLAAIYAYNVEEEPHFIVSQWAGNANGYVQSFSSVCGKWSVAECLVALRCVAGALAWLHERGIIHTALTVRNILLSQEDQPHRALVTDVAQGLVELEAQPIDWGTHLPYFSPERLRPDQEAKAGDSGDTLDIYAFGVVAYRLLTDSWPRAQKMLDSLERARSKPVQKDINDLARQLERDTQVGWGSKHGTVAEGGLRRIVEKCLALRPENRYTKMVEVLAAMDQIPGAEELFKDVYRPDVVTRDEQKIMRLARRAASESAGKTAPVPTVGTKTAPIAKAVPAAQTPPTGSGTHPTAMIAGGWPKSWTLGAAAAAVVGLGLAGSQFSKNRGLAAKLAETQAETTKLAAAKSEIESRVGSTDAAKQKAIDEKKVAEKNLAQQQLLTGKLFDSLIAFAPEDAIKRDQWREQVALYAERTLRFLEANHEDASQKQTCTIARWHLGATAQALGDANQAEKYYDDTAMAIDNILNSYTGKVEDNEWLPLQGKVMARRGELYLDSGRTAEAEQAFAEALKHLDQWLNVQSNDMNAARERIMVLLMDSRALRRKAEEASATERLTRAVKEMEDLMQTPAKRADDVILLAKLHAERGKTLANLKKIEEAQAAYLKAHETLRDFDRKNPKFRQSREVLAEIYGEFGSVLEVAGIPQDALMPVKESTTLWGDLLKEDTGSEYYCLSLGRALVTLARLQKGLQKPEDAKAAVSESVALLENLSSRRKSETRYKLHLGIAKAIQGELAEDQAKWVDAAKSADSASVILSEPGIEAGASVEEHREAMLYLARSLTTLGHSAKMTKQKEAAKLAYQRAQEAWQQVIANGEQTPATKSSIEFVAKELTEL